MPSNTLGYDAVQQHAPFPDWNVVTTRANDPRSRYHALGLELNKRLLRRPDVRRRRTRWREHKSDAGGTVPTAFAAENGATTVDLFRGDADYGNVAFTRRHRFVSTFLYELPFGRGRRFASGIGRGLDAARRRLGRHRRDAVPVGTVPDAVLQQRRSRRAPAPTSRGFTATQRPDQVGDGNLANPTADALLRPRRVRATGRQHRPLRQRRGRHPRSARARACSR